MSCKQYVERMAAYNAWMNARLYAAAGQLPAEALARDRQAFFGSILGTLQHIAVADTIWLKRFAGHPSRHAELDPVRAMAMPRSSDVVLFEDFNVLSAQRRFLDDIIMRWSASLSEHDLQHVLHYTTTQGVPSAQDCFGLLMHFFNHQTHHRGQATTLLTQAGVDVGVTDLVALIAETADKAE